MQKLTLDQLEVASFAAQTTSTEIDDLKGGTGSVCAWIKRASAAIADAFTASGSVTYTNVSTYDSANVHRSDSTTFQIKVGAGGSTAE